MTDSTDIDFDDLSKRAVELAAEILQASRENETSDERSRSAMMARMMRDERGKKFTIAMADQVLRVKRPARAADRMNSLLKEYGVPKYFGGFDQMALRVGNGMAGMFPKRGERRSSECSKRSAAMIGRSNSFAAKSSFWHQYLEE